MKFKDAFWVLFISMVPLIELRGAVPVGAGLGLPFYTNYLVAVIGNLIPIPFILLFIPKILDWLEGFKLFRPIVQWLHKKADKNRGKIDKSANVKSTEADMSENGAVYSKADTLPCDNAIGETSSLVGQTKMSAATFIGLMMFVLLPLPGTGAWTGALVASLFGFPRLKSFAAIAAGVIGCGVIMCLISYGVLGFLSFLA